MTRLTIEDARVLLSTLEDVQRAALRATGPDGLVPSPPMAELQCLIAEAARIQNVETHLWTVGALALRDVRTRVYMRTWNIDRRSFPHGFERLLDPDPRAMVGDAYPCFVVNDIEWSEDLDHLPGEIWITHREMRLAQGSLEARAREAVATRYPVAAIRWSLRSAASLAGHEDQMEQR